MAGNESARAAIERVEKLGMWVTYVSGFLVVTNTARPEPRREDAAEMELETIEELGKNMKEIFRVAAGRARGLRGRDFLGRQAFIPERQIVGTLTDCNADGVVTVSYRWDSGREHDTNSNHSGPGDDLLIIVDGDEQSDRSPSVLSPWIVNDRLRGLLERTESLGRRLAYDSGFLVVKWPAAVAADGEIVEAMVRELGRSIGEVREHLIARARGTGGEDFVAFDALEFWRAAATTAGSK